MDKLDKFEQLAFDAIYSAAVLRSETGFEFIDLHNKTSEQRTKELQSKHFDFVGFIGIVNGRPKVALALPLDEMTISALSAAFCHRIEEAINTVEKAMMGDSAGFSQRLYDLRDDRSEMN